MFESFSVFRNFYLKKILPGLSRTISVRISLNILLGSLSEISQKMSRKIYLKFSPRVFFGSIYQNFFLEFLQGFVRKLFHGLLRGLCEHSFMYFIKHFRRNSSRNIKSMFSKLSFVSNRSTISKFSLWVSPGIPPKDPQEISFWFIQMSLLEFLRIFFCCCFRNFCKELLHNLSRGIFQEILSWIPWIILFFQELFQNFLQKKSSII